MAKEKNRLMEEVEKWQDERKTAATMLVEATRTIRTRQAINPAALMTESEKRQVQRLRERIANCDARIEANRNAATAFREQVETIKKATPQARKIQDAVADEAKSKGLRMWSMVEAIECAKRGRWTGYQKDVRDYMTERFGTIQRVQESDGSFSYRRVPMEMGDKTFLIPSFTVDPIGSYERLSKRMTEDATYYPSSGTGAMSTTANSGGQMNLTNYDYTRMVGPHFYSDWGDRIGIPTVNEARTGKTTVPTIPSMSDVTLWTGEGAGVTAAANTTGSNEYTYRYASWGYYLTMLYKDLTPSEATAFLTVNLAEQAIKAKISWALINGSGSSGQPTGILNNSNVTQLSNGTNGAALSYASLLKMWKTLSNKNIEGEPFYYLMNGNCLATCGTLPFVSGGSEPILRDPNGSVWGSGVCPCNALPSDTTVGTSTNCSTVVLLSPLAMLRFFYGPLRFNMEDTVSNGATFGLLTQPYDGGVHDKERVVVMTGLTTTSV